MNENQEKIHSYSHLFVLTLVFSALATESFLLYSFLRESFWMPLEPSIVVAVMSIIFSGLGQRISKIDQVGMWILIVSVISSASYYEFFVAPTPLSNIGINILFYGFLAFTFGFGSWDALNDVWASLTRRKIIKKTAVLVFGTGLLVILAIFVASVYSTAIVSFFDSHPWTMTLIGVLATLLGGIFIGRRTKKI